MAIHKKPRQQCRGSVFNIGWLLEAGRLYHSAIQSMEAINNKKGSTYAKALFPVPTDQYCPFTDWPLQTAHCKPTFTS